MSLPSSPLKKLAARRLNQIQATRKSRALLECASLLDFIPVISPRYERPEHLSSLVDVIARSRVEPVRALVSVPPRHSKTETLLHAIAWLLACDPSITVGYVSYAADIAMSKSRLARDYALRAGVRLRDDANSMHEWRTVEGGGVIATGVGGPLTGHGVNLLIIDDPVKNRQDAESALMRQRAHEWFTSTATTRVEPGGSIVVCHCMVGDTPVLMANGSQKPLRNIAVGDSIATYADGALSTSSVLNWANQGPDSVFAIRMHSGIIVRANERHPFLVLRGGSTEWLKLRDLRIGDKIVRAMLPTGTGEASRALPMAATSRPSARRCAALITTGRGPRPGTSASHTPRQTDDVRISDTGTGLSLPNTTLFCSSKKVSAQCVVSRQVRTSLPSGAGSSVSTTTTIPEGSAVSSATGVTSRSVTGKTKKSCFAPLNTYAITHDEIISITEDGYEDVFDIQVAATENFIANGLVSHNTRWHADDLIGRLSSAKDEDWDSIHFPAINEQGDALWPTRWPLAALEEKRRAIGEYDWAALFQGSPVPRGGQLFKEPARYESPRITGARIVIGVDPAASEKTHADHSVAVVIAVTGHGVNATADVLEVYRAQKEIPALCADLEQLQLKWDAPMAIEAVGVGKAVPQVLKAINPRLRFTALAGADMRADKFSRAQPVAAAWNQGRVRLPLQGFWLREFQSEVQAFTGISDVHDDQVDALAHAWNFAQRSGGGAASSYDDPRAAEDRGAGVSEAEEAIQQRIKELTG